MGVTGLDLDMSGKSSMSRTQGWPRHKSLHNINANDKTLTFNGLMEKMVVVPSTTLRMPVITPVFAH